MDPCYLDICEVDASTFHPYNAKKSRETRVGLDLFRLVSLLGFSAS